MPPTTRIDRDSLADKFAGCLLGLAIGDAIGLPPEGMTPYEVYSKFHFIDGFFQSPPNEPGTYTAETRSAVYVGKSIVECGKVDNEKLLVAIPEWEQRDPIVIEKGSGRKFYSRTAPIALMAAGLDMPDRDFANSCKTVATGRPKRDMVAYFIFGNVIRECVRNSRNISNGFELYEAKTSLLSRMIDLSARLEAKIEDMPPGGALCDRLAFVQKKLMDNRYTNETLFGVMGSGADAPEALAMSLYSFLSGPDEFGSVYDIVSLGGPSTLLGAMVGALVGAYVGASSKTFPSDMKDSVQNGTKLEALAGTLADLCCQTEPKT